MCVPKKKAATQETPKHRISGTGRNIPLAGYIKRHLTAHLAPKFQSRNLDHFKIKDPFDDCLQNYCTRKMTGFTSFASDLSATF